MSLFDILAPIREQLTYCKPLLQVGIHTIISAERFKTQDYYQMLLQVCPELENATPGDIQSKEYVAACHHMFKTSAYISIVCGL